MNVYPRAYHVKASPGERYGGRRIMVQPTPADLWRDAGTVPAQLAQQVCNRIACGELPADAIRWARERDQLPRCGRK